MNEFQLVLIDSNEIGSEIILRSNTTCKTTNIDSSDFTINNERNSMGDKNESDYDSFRESNKRKSALWDEKEMMNLVYAVDKEG